VNDSEHCEILKTKKYVSTIYEKEKSKILYQLSSGGEPLGGVGVEADYVLTGCAAVKTTKRIQNLGCKIKQSKITK